MLMSNKTKNLKVKWNKTQTIKNPYIFFGFIFVCIHFKNITIFYILEYFLKKISYDFRKFNSFEFIPIFNVL